MIAFKNANIYIEGQGVVKTDLTFADTVLKIGEAEGEVIALPSDAIVVPAFIDEHIHGAGGADVMDGTEEALATISRTVAQEGTAHFVATTMTQSPTNIERALQAVKNYRKKQNGILGVHLEGPFISPAYVGAQPKEYVQKPNVEQFKRFQTCCDHAIKIVTLAPEEEGATELIAYLAANGIVPSLGHTAASNADIRRSIQKGAKCVTHTFNAQSHFLHREIGTAGSALLYDELCSELIADTIHVSVPAIQLLVKCKPKNKLVLITDAMRAKGLGDGVSELGGQTVYVQNGQARLADGTLAGSVLKMNEAVKNLVQKCGVPLENAVDMATINPAINLGIEKDYGSIRIGKRADFTVLNEQFTVCYTIRGGKMIYQAK